MEKTQERNMKQPVEKTRKERKSFIERLKKMLAATR